MPVKNRLSALISACEISSQYLSPFLVCHVYLDFCCRSQFPQDVLELQAYLAPDRPRDGAGRVDRDDHIVTMAAANDPPDSVAGVELELSARLAQPPLVVVTLHTRTVAFWREQAGLLTHSVGPLSGAVATNATLAFPK